jgi:hypothetical protein
MVILELVILDSFFFVGGVWSWLADRLHFILSFEAGFYKPTILPFAGLQHMQQCQVNFHLIIVPSFDPN